MSAQQTMNDVTNHANIEEEEPQEDLPSVFERAVSLWKSIEEGNVENETDAAKTCSALMRLCQRRVEKADFFSHNETVEDVQTHCLKYVLCYHYTGLALLRATVDPTERLHYLRDAKTLLNRFLQRCEQLELVTENEKKLIYESDSLDSTQLRQYKIQRHKEEKEARETLKHLLSDAKMNDEYEADEELVRKRWMTQISLAIVKSTDELRLIDQELPILEHMKKMREENGPEKVEQERQRERQKSSQGALDPSRKGIEVTRVDPNLQQTRETIKAQVFRPSHNPPTMSLDEFAEREVEAARSREQSAQEKEKDAVRKYKELEKEGLEDDEELAEKAVYRDRAWDDWKDEHARGVGNTKRV